MKEADPGALHGRTWEGAEEEAGWSQGSLLEEGGSSLDLLERL